MNFKNKNIFNWALLILWMGVIFYFSNQPDLKSGFESQLDFILRKAAHIAEYAILTFLAWRAVSDKGEKKGIKYLIIAVVFSIFYATSDEYHQLYTRGRVGSPVDVLIDSIGIVITSVGIWRKTLKL